MLNYSEYDTLLQTSLAACLWASSRHPDKALSPLFSSSYDTVLCKQPFDQVLSALRFALARSIPGPHVRFLKEDQAMAPPKFMSRL